MRLAPCYFASNSDLARFRSGRPAPAPAMVQNAPAPAPARIWAAPQVSVPIPEPVVDPSLVRFMAFYRHRQDVALMEGPAVKLVDNRLLNSPVKRTVLRKRISYGLKLTGKGNSSLNFQSSTMGLT